MASGHVSAARESSGGSDEGYVKVCVDGPVFPLDSIEFEAEADFGGEEVAGCERKD